MLLAVTVSAIILNALYFSGLYQTSQWQSGRLRLKSKAKGQKSNKSVVLLMSFPNSVRHKSITVPLTDKPGQLTSCLPFQGTSYTMVNVEKMTNTSGGTNYDAEVAEEECCPMVVDLLSESSAQNPSHPWTEAAPLIHRPTRHIPDQVLTKTHCSVGDATSYEEFVQSCFSVVFNSNRPGNVTVVPYSKEVPVSKFVHLIRSPMDNLVSRKHMAVRKAVKSGSVSDGERAEFLLNDTVDSFQDWCKQYDLQMLPRILHRRNSEALRDWLTELADTTGHLTIPCLSDLYWYVNWHNWAFQLTHNQVSLLLRYEDYTNDYNTTVTRLLNFLGLTAVAAPAAFESYKSYAYYSDDQLLAIRDYVKLFSSEESWDVLRRYFE